MEHEKQRKRLIELLNEATFGVNTQTLADHLKKETIERVADYLIANNVVVLPLKVGSVIYRLDLINNKIIDWTIARIDIYEDEVVYCDDCFNVFTDEEFGVSGGVYLSREDAENALKEKLK